MIYREGRYLMVRELRAEGLRLNQPAGHLEEGESLVQACIRETWEETGYRFQPQGILGMYLARYSATMSAASAASFLRFAFVGEVPAQADHQMLDTGIVEACWLTSDEILGCTQLHRSPLVQQCIHDHQAMLQGRRQILPLDALQP